MNASPNHSKVKVSITLSDPTFVAGGAVTGKMEMECKTDRGLGIGIIMVELFAVEGGFSFVLGYVSCCVFVVWDGLLR